MVGYADSRDKGGNQVMDMLAAFGYAPGDYMLSCHICKKQVWADKRAITCLDCATNKSKEHQADEEVKVIQDSLNK